MRVLPGVEKLKRAKIWQRVAHKDFTSGFVLAFRAMNLAELVTDDDNRAFIRVQITDMNS